MPNSAGMINGERSSQVDLKKMTICFFILHSCNDVLQPKFSAQQASVQIWKAKLNTLCFQLTTVLKVTKQVHIKFVKLT